MSLQTDTIHLTANPSSRNPAPIRASNKTIEPNSMDFSIVVPLYNEAESLVELSSKIKETLDGYQFEIIFIDDGSRDNSWQIISELAAGNPKRIRGYQHRSNQGKAEALATGFQNVKGDIVITLDADLQDDPSEIFALKAKLDEGYDLVSGWKERRQDPLSKTIPSLFFNYATRVASGLHLHDFNCGLKAYRREALENIHLYGELHRFIPLLIHSEGYRVTELLVRHHPREHGVSKYGWKRLFKGALDLITVVLLTRYLKRPGHFFGAIGMIGGALGTGILAYLSTMKLFFGENIGPRPLFFLGLLLILFSGQMLSTGFLGEFLLRHRGRKRSNSIVMANTSPDDTMNVD